ncbi:hypothetical protein [Bergeyella cardium]|nr:hypothetical protein [Bergeyella cardium]WHE33433.1 hypothetical protein P8603_08100 [Bergeyella cardium]WHF60083.1 hypothetical protein O0R51_08095 [Bergeyella cardium]
MIELLKLYIAILLGQLEKRDDLALSGEGDSPSRARVSRSLGR